MQDPSTAFQPMKPHFPEQGQLKCPRCESSNTKFCYYNNYNLSQPRHYCKNCKRYWTKGGTLRNIPVGGSTRKGTKRNSSSLKHADPDPRPDSTRTVPRRAMDSSPASSSSMPVAAPSSELTGSRHPGTGQDPTCLYGLEGGPERKILDMGGSFSSLLASSGQLGNFLEGVTSNGSGFKMVPLSGFGEDSKSDLRVGLGQDPGLDLGGGVTDHDNGGSGGGEGESYLQSGDWGNSNGWPDLAIYTPGSSFR